MISEYKWFAWTLIVIALLIRYWIGKRRFKRRGVGGLQHYSSYGKGLVISTIEKIVGLLSILILLFGLFLLFAMWLEKRKQKEIESRAVSSILIEPKFHFLVPPEEGFGRKKISPLPKASFPMSMKPFGKRLI